MLTVLEVAKKQGILAESENRVVRRIFQDQKHYSKRLSNQGISVLPPS